jgi:mannose-6-phosphate isomerase
MSSLIAYPGPDPVISLLQDSGTRMIKSAGTSATRLPKSNKIVEAQT